MKSRIRIMGCLSVVLLICVLLGQGAWMYRVREMKVDEFRKTADYVLRDIIQIFLDNQTPFAIKKLNLTYFLSNENEFCWIYNNKEKKMSIKALDEYNVLGRQVVYDCLFENKCLDIQKIAVLYHKALQEKGISESPYLIIKGLDGNKLLLSDKLNVEPNNITTSPLNLGYDYKHQITASFKLPFVFRALKGVLWIELLFLIGFVICLVWQWNSIKMTLRSVRVQTMGIAHLEHELKKPLATMISVIGGMLKRKESVLCPTDEVKLGMIKARLMKMADITDTMLTSLKTSVLEVEREPIDLQLELEMITEMFTMIRKHARVEYHIAEGLGYPCLDKIYFNYIVINLVDNAIKYGGAHPVVKINFYEEGTDYILVVEDNGMGIAPKDQKQIFKQFYRVRNQQVTKTTGFGLGLTFVHKVVCAYGGKIHIESEIGNGSKFLIILPQVSWKN
ncbi:sensor histidine kinase [Odoribacter splanchnicus]|uniref:sensor histidine kinase n=1 Tax=Odoribacter splanchnicus TaxID=28118 RepID=UPI0036F285C6